MSNLDDAMEAASATANSHTAPFVRGTEPHDPNVTNATGVVDVELRYVGDALSVVFALLTIFLILQAGIIGVYIHARQAWPVYPPAVLAVIAIIPATLKAVLERRQRAGQWHKLLQQYAGTPIERLPFRSQPLHDVAAAVSLRPTLFASGLAKNGFVGRLVRICTPWPHCTTPSDIRPFPRAMEAVALSELDPVFRANWQAIEPQDGAADQKRQRVAWSLLRVFHARWSQMVYPWAMLSVLASMSTSPTQTTAYRAAQAILAIPCVVLFVRALRILLWKAWAAPGALTHRALLRQRRTSVYTRENSVLVYRAADGLLIASDGRDTTVFHLTPLETEFAMRAWLSDVGRPTEAQLRQLLDGD